MSAPQTNIEKQTKRHIGPLVGMAVAVAVAIIVAIWWGMTANEPQVPPDATGTPPTTEPVN